MKLGYIKLGKEKYPVCFSLSAIEKICDEFGSLDAMKDKVVSGDVKANIRVIEIMLDAGRAYCTAMELDCPPPLKCYVGDLIGPGDDIMDDVLDTMRSDSDREVETRGKN